MPAGGASNSSPSHMVRFSGNNSFKGGRPLFDPMSMFKVLTLQVQHNLSDAKMKTIVRCHLSRMLFLDFELGGATSDENTILHLPQIALCPWQQVRPMTKSHQSGHMLSMSMFIIRAGIICSSELVGLRGLRLNRHLLILSITLIP